MQTFPQLISWYVNGIKSLRKKKLFCDKFKEQRPKQVTKWSKNTILIPSSQERTFWEEI